MVSFQRTVLVPIAIITGAKVMETGQISQWGQAHRAAL